PPTSPAQAPPAKPATKPVRPRWRKILKRILIALSVIVLIVGSIAAWAVNRYLIEHVQIADVSTYEATVRASTTTIAGASTTAPPAPPTVTDSTYTYGATSISV